MVVYIDFDNGGFSDVEDVFTFVLVKAVDTPSETLYVNFLKGPKITKARGRNEAYKLPVSKRIHLTCHVGVGYTWKIKNLRYLDEKFFRFTYQKEPEKYRIHVLMEKDIQKLWR